MTVVSFPEAERVMMLEVIPSPEGSDAVDAVMSRAVAVRYTNPRSSHFEQYMAYLPGTSLQTIFREDSTMALAALRVALVRLWEPIVAELLAWEKANRELSEARSRGRGY